MKRDAAGQAYFVGWDVGGWNCDRNALSRDAIVILDDALTVVGKPWRGNLRASIEAARGTGDWLRSLFAICDAPYPETRPTVTMAIDTPLGFADAFVDLVTGRGIVEADPVAGLNRYLFRSTERHLFEQGLRPLSAVKDMIGSQATKGMHVLAKFARRTESCGVWTDGAGFRAIETYPSACRDTELVRERLAGKPSLGHDDKDDARVCAVIAEIFATRRELLEPPPEGVSLGEGWIWVPRSRAVDG